MVGRKGKPLLDSIDLEILEYLVKDKNKISVLELVRALNISHQNLKKHLEKLLRCNLIFSSRGNSNNKIMLFSPENLFHHYDIQDLNDEIKIEEEVKNHKIILEMLREINSYDNESQTLMDITLELNRMKKENNEV